MPCTTTRAFGWGALRLDSLRLRGRGQLAEHVKKLYYREADPERQVAEWLLIMIINKLTAVRANQDWQGHVKELYLCSAVYILLKWSANCAQNNQHSE